MPLPSTILYPASGGGGGGAGDVIGPGSSTDNAIARWSGTGGDTLQNSVATVADTTGTIDNSSGGGKFVSGGTNGTCYFPMGGTTSSFYGLGKDGNGVSTILRADAGTLGNFRAGRIIADTMIHFGSATTDPGVLLSSGNFFVISGDFATPKNLSFARLVEASTAGSGAPNVLVANESMATITNEGATAAAYNTLPTAAAGYIFTFIVQDADGLRVTAASGDTIRVIDKVTAAGGYIESTTIGSCVTLLSINATEWYAISIKGVWTDGTFTYDDTGLTSP